MQELFLSTETLRALGAEVGVPAEETTVCPESCVITDIKCECPPVTSHTP